MRDNNRGNRRSGGRNGGRHNNNRRSGGRGDRNRSGGRSQNNRHSRGRGRYNNRGGRRPVRSVESGNQRERIAVESGYLVLIDQFMLANSQFANRILEVIDEAPEAKDEIIARYGGAVVSLTPGTYRIQRDPYAYSIIVHPDGDAPETEDLSERATTASGHVFIDTRCLAMIDRELLDDSALLERYSQLWIGGQEKACRDLLRDNGGAVRYGFERFGDELGVYCVPDGDILCLWPEVSEPIDISAEGEVAENGGALS